jgi:hypothetical protein
VTAWRLHGMRYPPDCVFAVGDIGRPRRARTNVLSLPTHALEVTGGAGRPLMCMNASRRPVH